jgi:hypothetical protein
MVSINNLKAYSIDNGEIKLIRLFLNIFEYVLQY